MGSWRFVPVFLAGLLLGCGNPVPDGASKSPDLNRTEPQGPRVVRNQESSNASPFRQAKSIVDGLADAEKSSGYVVLVFEAAWSAPCQLLRKEVLSNPEIAQIMSGAVIVSVDVDSESGRDLKARHKVNSIPYLEFMDTKGHAFGAIAGYSDVTKFKKSLTPILQQGSR